MKKIQSASGMNYSMHLNLHSFKKTCKTIRYKSDKEKCDQKVQEKKKQRTSLNKNVTDVFRSTKDLMSKKCEHFKSAMLFALRKNKFAGHTCI